MSHRPLVLLAALIFVVVSMVSSLESASADDDHFLRVVPPSAARLARFELEKNRFERCLRKSKGSCARPVHPGVRTKTRAAEVDDIKIVRVLGAEDKVATLADQVPNGCWRVLGLDVCPSPDAHDSDCSLAATDRVPNVPYCARDNDRGGVDRSSTPERQSRPPDRGRDDPDPPARPDPPQPMGMAPGD